MEKDISEDKDIDEYYYQNTNTKNNFQFPIKLFIFLTLVIFFICFYIIFFISKEKEKPKQNINKSPPKQITDYIITNFSQLIANNNSLSTTSNEKPKKKLYYLDEYNHLLGFLIEHLKIKYDIIETKDDPDYIFFSIYGNKHLEPKYKNCIKIFFTAENSVPDFNECDYALGPSFINYGDRFLHLPYFAKRFSFLNSPGERIFIPNKKFCAWVVSNGKYKIRNKFFDKLSKYKNVDSGGKFRNNIGGQPIKNKIQFLKGYKFSIQFENSVSPGYCTEKIFDGFYSGTIPIYYGDETIIDIINPKAFVLVKNEKDFDKAIELIKEIDNNDELYKKMLKEPIYIEKDYPQKLIQKLRDYLSYIFDQDLKMAKRIYSIE